MDNGAASAFVYSKACGMLSKSFVGKNLHTLFSVRSLSELYTLLFTEEVPAVPEKMLTKLIERKAEEKFFSDYIKLLSCYSEPEKIFTDLLRFYDYENLKEMGSVLALGGTEKKDYAIPQKYSVLNYSKWPDIQKITEKSQVSWYNKVVAVDELQDVDNKIDVQYIHELWQSAKKLPSEVRDDILSVVKEEVVMRNLLWALRLKVYYKMPAAQIMQTLAYEGNRVKTGDLFAKDAIAILEKDVDSYSDWQDWKYKDLLNSNVDGNQWTLDPTWVERSWKAEFTRKISRLFHKTPLSPLVLFCFFKIKQTELDCITTVAEGLRLDVDQASMLEVAGLSKMEQR